ncbi:hypothetical protein BGP_5836 [Beggiatoa sp. PS]|nr:hypothetical protein BGP_5836 [Beggiatoa sp. PS]
MNIKLSFYELLILGIMAPIIVGIILYHYPDLIGEPISEPEEIVIPADIAEQLKQLHNPKKAFKVILWLNEPNKTQFTTTENVTLYYKISDLPENTPAYLSLFNISPVGELSTLLLNRTIEAGEIYTLPDAQIPVQPGTAISELVITQQLNLEAGQEYFKALVTSEPIVKTFLTTMTEALQTVKFWGTAELMVKVK